MPTQRVETSGRLVEERQHRIVYKRLGQLDALFHACGVRPDVAVARLLQSHMPQDIGRAHARLVRGQPAHLRHIGQELRTRHRVRQAIVLGHVADALTQLGRVEDLVAVEQRLPLVRVDQAQEQLERRALARPVGPEKPRHAGLDHKARVVQRDGRPIGLRQMSGLEECRHCE